MAQNKNLVNQDCRNTEVTLVLRHFIGSCEPNFLAGGREPTLPECLAFLQQRYQTSSEVDPKRTSEVRGLQLSLSEIIDAQTLESVCQDNLFLDILIELVERNISPKEIIEVITHSEPIKIFNVNIPLLLSSNPEITDDQTKFLSFANVNQPDNVDKTDKRNLNGSTILAPSGMHGAQSTPLLSQLRNRPNLYANSLNNSTLMPMRNLSIKDAIELIPKYNGVNIPLSAFLDGCREARSMIPPVNEPDLAKLIKMRLFGEALRSAQSKIFTNIDEIAKFFNSIFGSAKTCHQLHGELANIRQKRTESVITYSNKIKAVAQELLEAAIREKRVTSGYTAQLEKDKVKFFIRGLHWVIKARMGQAENLDVATEQAIEIERDFACYDTTELNATIKTLGELEIKTPERSQINRIEVTEVVSCRFCRRAGHLEKNCWVRQREQEGAAPQVQAGSNAWSQPRRDRPADRNLGRGPVDDRYWQRNRALTPHPNYSPNTQRSHERQNFVKKSCNYCNKEGHWKSECRKLEYRNRMENKSSGNEKGFSRQDATGGIQETQRPK